MDERELSRQLSELNRKLDELKLQTSSSGLFWPVFTAAGFAAIVVHAVVRFSGN